MNKKTKMLLGVGAVAAAAYYFWNKSKTTKAYANQMGNYSQGLYDPSRQASSCYGHNISCPDGKIYCIGFDQEYKCPTNATKTTVVATKPIQVAKPKTR
jgi:hypothetical protein